MRYILAIDQSTSATKAAILSEEGEQVCSASLRHRQIYPKPGWVEHDAQEIYQNVLQTCGQVLEHFEAQGGGELAAMGISNQRETVVLCFVTDVLRSYGFEYVDYVYEPGQYACF